MLPLRRRPNRTLGAIAIVLGLAGLSASTLPGFDEWRGGTDFHYNILLSAARETVVEHHQFPLWNPYAHGGISFAADPVAEHLGPTFLLHLVLGVYRGVLAEFILFAVLGGVGLILLARELGAGREASILAGALFAVSNSLPAYLVHGWFNHMTHGLMPIGMWLYVRAERREDAFSVALSAVLGLLLLEADVYHFVYMVAWLGLMAAADGMRQRRLRPIGLVAGTVAAGLAIGAARILPIVAMKNSFGEQAEVAYSLTPLAALRGLLDWERPWEGFPGTERLWESAGYVGPLAAILALIGVFAFKRRLAPLAVTALLFFVYSLGSNLGPERWAVDVVAHDPGGPSVARWSRDLPLLGAIRNPSRALVVVAMAALAASSVGLESVASWAERLRARAGRPLVIALALVLAVYPAHRSARRYIDRHSTPLPNLPFERVTRFRQERDIGCPHSLGPILNVGILAANMPLERTPSALRAFREPGYRGEAWWTGEGRASVERWSPHEILVSLEGEGEGRLIVNQQFAPEWGATGSVLAAPEAIDSLLSVKARAPGRARFRYAPPPSALIGALSSCVAAIGAIAALIGWWRIPGVHSRPAPGSEAPASSSDRRARPSARANGGSGPPRARRS